MRKALTGTILILLVVVLSGAAYAGPASKLDMAAGVGRGPGIGLALSDPAVGKEIGLSDQQIAQIKSLLAKERDENITQRSEVEKAQAAVFDQMKEPRLDQKKLRDLTKALTEARAEMIRLHTEHYIALRQQLTDEQYRKLQEIIKQRRPGLRGLKKNSKEPAGFDKEDIE